MNNWISIEDRLPEIDEDVLVTYIGMMGQSCIEIAYMEEDLVDSSRKSFFEENGELLENVVAWMLLPEPYTGE